MNIKKLILLCGTMLVIFTNVNAHSENKDEANDSDRKSKIKTRSIGEIEYQTSNLSVSKFRNGIEIPQAKNSEEWKAYDSKKEAAWCYPNYDESFQEKGVKIYNYYAVINENGLAPLGWHIPNAFEMYQILCDSSASDYFSWYYSNDFKKKKFNSDIYKEKSVFVFERNQRVLPGFFHLYSNTDLKNLAYGKCTSNGTFTNVSTYSSEDNPWQGTWWTTSELLNGSSTKIIFSIKFDPKQPHVNSIIAGEIDKSKPLEGFPIICVKDYFENKNSNNLITIEKSRIPLIKVDSVIIDYSIRIRSKKNIYFYQGKAYEDRLYQRPIFNFLQGNQNPSPVTLSQYKKIYLDMGYKESSLRDLHPQEVIYDYIGLNCDFDTIFSHVSLFEYNGYIYSTIPSLKTDNKINYLVEWCTKDKYEDQSTREKIKTAIVSNAYIYYFFEKDKSLYSNEYKLLFDNIKYCIDISSFSSFDSLYFHSMNGDLKMNNTDNDFLFKYYPDYSRYSKEIATKDMEVRNSIYSANQKKFTPKTQSIIVTATSIQKKEPFENVTVSFNVNSNQYFKFAYSLAKDKIDSMIAGCELEKINTLNKLSEHFSDNNLKIGFKRFYLSTIASYINEKKLPFEVVFNLFQPLLIDDSLKSWALNSLINAFRYKYDLMITKDECSNPTHTSLKTNTFLSDYKHANRKIKNLMKGLYLIYGDSEKIFDSLLVDNDIQSYDCQIFNALLSYCIEYPKGHHSASTGSVPGRAINFKKLSIIVMNGNLTFLPSPELFACDLYIPSSLSSCINYLNRAKSLNPKRPEEQLLRIMFSERNFIQRQIDPCTMSETCSQCDQLRLIIGKQLNLPTNYFSNLKKSYQLNCVECELCQYNICGGNKVRKKDGTLDMRYNSNKK